MEQRRRKFWGWGYEEEAPSEEHQRAIGAMLTARLGGEPLELQAPPRIEEIASKSKSLRIGSSVRRRGKMPSSIPTTNKLLTSGRAAAPAENSMAWFAGLTSESHSREAAGATTVSALSACHPSFCRRAAIRTHSASAT